MIIGVPIPHNYFAPIENIKCLLDANKNHRIIFAEGPYIYMNRNYLIDQARIAGESLLMIDSDMIFSMEDIVAMEGHLEEHDCVTGVYCNTQPPFPPQIFKKSQGEYKIYDPKYKTDLIEIDACGGGFLALSEKLIQDLPKEACNNVIEGEIEHGEDISLCFRIQQAGYKIFVDPYIQLGHLRTNPMYCYDVQNLV